MGQYEREAAHRPEWRQFERHQNERREWHKESMKLYGVSEGQHKGRVNHLLAVQIIRMCVEATILGAIVRHWFF